MQNYNSSCSVCMGVKRGLIDIGGRIEREDAKEQRTE
jgi:hypothetical protein